MSRRCKPGQRARVVVGVNKGRIVLVARALHEGTFNGAHWPKAIFPWVVASLGDGLQSVDLKTNMPLPPAHSIVLCDRDLEPLDDDDDGLAEPKTEEVGRRISAS